ncbi:MAG: cell wall hydrolase [Clostridiales bacterium]|nr:cell wall hydrolase [Clostridiales bacterium]
MRHGLIPAALCGLFAVCLAVGISIVSENTDRVYASAEATEGDSESTAQDDLPTGISGVVSGVEATPSAGSTVERIGTSGENVMIGQRVSTVSENVTGFDVSDSLDSVVDTLDGVAISLAQSANMMSDSDYEILLQIVEAEAGTEDVKGRVLVANVIMNRVKSENYPDTVTDAVFQEVNGVTQFSPTEDGRIYSVTVTDETREAVKQVLNGTDYSEGALYFIQKDSAEQDGIDWFDQNLQYLFKHGVHEFYTDPDVDSEAVTMVSAEEE